MNFGYIAGVNAVNEPIKKIQLKDKAGIYNG